MQKMMVESSLKTASVINGTGRSKAEQKRSYLPLIKLDLTSKVAKLESPSNISGRLPVSVLKLAENVSTPLVRAFNVFTK